MRWLAAAALAFSAGPALAACTVTALPVTFGSYNPIGEQDLDSTGRVDIACVPAAPYTITLGTGLSNSYTPRSLASGASRLPYNLYTDASYNLVWGDKSAGTAVVGGGAATASHTVYGRIPRKQNVGAGVYADTVVVTVSF